MSDRVRSFSSQDAEEADDRLRSMLGPETKVRVLGSPNGFSIALTSVRLGRLLVSTARARGVSTVRATGDLVHIAIPTAGTPLTYRSGSRSSVVAVGDSAVGRPADTVAVSVEDGAGVTLYAPVAALIERAERLALGSLRGLQGAQMADRVDLRAPSGRALERMMRMAIAEIVALESSGLAPLAAAGFEDLLTSHAAAALFPAVLTLLGVPSAEAAPTLVRRARDYIKANAAEPLALSRLAADLGMPIRTLQDNFRRHFGLSLRDWLMECRLENARQALTWPEGPTSVSAVAEASGFANLGDFSVQYRKKYGVPPSETLRDARRRRA